VRLTSECPFINTQLRSDLTPRLKRKPVLFCFNIIVTLLLQPRRMVWIPQECLTSELKMSDQTNAGISAMRAATIQ
jgi:hypothetical protein